MEINRAVIIYAGSTGSDLAEEAKMADLEVDLIDVRDESLQRVIKQYGDPVYKTQRPGARKKHTVIGKEVCFLTFQEADLVIECTDETLNYKKTLFRLLDHVCHPKTIFATNSFPFNLTEIALGTKRPSKIVGLHIDPQGKVVEIIKNIATTGETVQDVKNFMQKLNKTIIEFSDYPASIMHYMIMPTINEAVYYLMEGVDNAEEIDTFMRINTNLPVGPLALADLIGLDDCLVLLERLYSSTGDNKYRPCQLFYKYINSGWLGCKTGRGFHKYKDSLN